MGKHNKIINKNRNTDPLQNTVKSVTFNFPSQLKIPFEQKDNFCNNLFG